MYNKVYLIILHKEATNSHETLETNYRCGHDPLHDADLLCLR